ncbi:hypothetical protein FS837_006995, partial [Tulasnella sp. UAMH 9824]
MTTLSDIFSSFPTTTFPNACKTPAPPRFQALYSDVYWLKQSNPEAFQSSVVKKSKQPQPQSNGHLVLHASDKLAEALRWDKVGRPIGLGAVLEDLAADKTIIALPTFLKSVVSIHYQPSLAYRVASFVVGRPLWWAWSIRVLVNERAEMSELSRRLCGAIYPQGATISQRRSKPPGFTESLYKRQSFQAEVESVGLKGTTMSLLDVGVVMKYLKRDAEGGRRSGERMGLPGTIRDVFKLTVPADGITEVDFGVLEIKATLQKLTDQISGVEQRVE